MSSILDALRKLEEEKAAASQAVDIIIDDHMAERDLVGDSAWANPVPVKVTPMVLGVAGLLVVMLVLAGSVTTAMLITRASTSSAAVSGPESMNTAAMIPAVSSADQFDVAATIAPAHDITEVPPHAAIPADVDAPVEEPVRDQRAAVAPTPPPRTQSAPPLEIPGAVRDTAPMARQTPSESPAPRRELRPVETPPPAPAEMSVRDLPLTSEVNESPRIDPAPDPPLFTSPEPARITAEAPPPIPSNISELPPLTPSLRSQYRLNKALNMPRPQNNENPIASAVIDRTSIFVGETIPNTNARLIAVERRGIAIEIIGTGERYYWHFR